MIDKALQKFEMRLFRTALIDWYNQNKRDLPWRKTKDPYAIWVSEVMLQQTKVETVIDYYNKFMRNYPTIFHLAEAEEQEVLKDWEGLGYYSRARNLHNAVKEVVETYDGVVPNDAKKLAELKGIGPYTKGAIMSIAFNEPEPAVDGNVMRVLARILLIDDNILDQKTRRRFEVIVRELISKENPSAFNQGLMELGALICIPRSPRCEQCPVKAYCRAYKNGMERVLPIRKTKTKQKTKKYVSVCLYDEEGKVAIEQRGSEGLLANMWQLPMIEKDAVKKRPLVEIFQEKYDLEITITKKLGNVKHVFSHLIWEIVVHEAKVEGIMSDPFNGLLFVHKTELEQFPIATAHQKVVQYIEGY